MAKRQAALAAELAHRLGQVDALTRPAHRQGRVGVRIRLLGRASLTLRTIGMREHLDHVRFHCQHLAIGVEVDGLQLLDELSHLLQIHLGVTLDQLRGVVIAPARSQRCVGARFGTGHIASKRDRVPRQR